jgi:hypothetical protein
MRLLVSARGFSLFPFFFDTLVVSVRQGAKNIVGGERLKGKEMEERGREQPSGA